MIDPTLSLKPAAPRSNALSRLRELLSLAWPIYVGQLAQTATGVVDTIMSGAVSAADLAGVAVGASLWVPILLFMVGILTASTAIIAQLHGAEKEPEIQMTAQQTIWVALGLGVLATVLVLNSHHLFEWMSVEAEISAIGSDYLFYIAMGLPGVAIFQMFRSVSEGSGFTKPIMLITLLSFLLNIPLNYIFIHGLFGLPAMGGAGCGPATAILMWFNVFTLRLLLSKESRLRERLPRGLVAPDFSRIGQILSLGTPIALSIFAEVSIFALVALIIGHLGSTVVAGHQIALSVSSLTFMLPLSIAMALTVKVGHSLGAREPQQARKMAWTGIYLGVSCSIVGAGLMIGLAETITSVYTNDQEVALLAQQLLLFAALFQISDAIQACSAGALRGYKDTRVTLAITLFAYWLIGLPLGYTISLTDLWGPAHPPHGFWIGFLAALSVAALLLIVRLLKVMKVATDSTRRVPVGKSDGDRLSKPK